SVKALGGKGYANPIALDGLRVYLEAMEALDVPLVSFWAWDDFCKPPHEPSIRSAEHKEVIELLREFQKRWQENRQPAKRGISEETKQRIELLNRKWREMSKN
ncbi:MAG: hypothetical protein RMK18_11405, partial [Armatimonadota bacterium]|nr:hypothetical protein [Armatimonadota bacterium]